MVNYTSGYTNIGGIPLGSPISSPFEPTKHLESNSYQRVFGRDNVWMGILQLLNNYDKMKMPFISMTELSKNVLEVEGPGSTITFGVPFVRGCPFILENLSGSNPKPGLGNEPFFILLSENTYANGDVLTTDYRNGRQLRVQTIKEKGSDAEIIPYLNGWRYLVALDSYDEEAWYPQEFLVPGTPYMKLYQHNGGEFSNEMSTYSGMDERDALQLYQYTVGNSEQAIQTWVTADATYRNFKIENKLHPMLQHLQGASADVLTYWTGQGDGKKKPIFWIPTFIQKLAGELAKMKENLLTWGTGLTYVSNGREKQTVGLGFYQQIKQRGNYDTYSTPRQLFNLVLNFSEKLFTVHNQVSPEDRIVKLRAGKFAYQELRKQFSSYFKTDNPFTVFADHPALIKAGLLTNDSKGGLIYKPVQFNGIFFPEQGTLLVEHDPTLDKIDEYLETTPYASYVGNSAGMVFIEDITSGNFTNAIPAEMKNSSMSYKNTLMIKQRGYKDKIEFLVGSGCSEELVKMLDPSLNPNQIMSYNKGMGIALRTQGEIWVQDPSRVWLLEYDPEGVIKKYSQNFTNLAF